MQPSASQLTYFFILLFGGWAVELAFYNKKHRRLKFSLKNYLLFAAGPIAATVYAVVVFGRTAVYVYLLSVVAGSFGEYFADRSYAALFGANLWRYYRFNLKGRTSWLVLPIWGVAGVALYLLAITLFTT